MIPRKQTFPRPHATLGQFFQGVDEMLVKRLRREASAPEAREKLIRSTGLEDEILIDELAELGVTAEGIVAIRLVPLLLVAWAEDRVDDAERKAIVEESKRLGIVEGSVPAILLEHWLHKIPRRVILDAWRRYMIFTVGQMSPAARRKTVDSVHHRMTAVAKASGGYLGIGRVTAKERRMIKELLQMLQSQ